jgi:hypothetical protein
VKRLSAYNAAAKSAFGRSRGAAVVSSRTGEFRLRPTWVLFVAGFPGAFGLLAATAAFSRGGTSDGAFPLAMVALAGSVALLALGLASRLATTDDRLTVRFYGFRSTAVRFAELTSATFGMAFPSLSFAITLTDRNRTKATVHANWWDKEATILRVVFTELLRNDVSMDRATARVVSQTLGVKRPKPRIVHHALLRKGRTW